MVTRTINCNFHISKALLFSRSSCVCCRDNCEEVRRGSLPIILLANVHHVTKLYHLPAKHSFVSFVTSVSGTSIRDYFSKNNKCESVTKLGFQIPKVSARLISLCGCFIFIFDRTGSRYTDISIFFILCSMQILVSHLQFNN